jgi:Flp pilus assembly protein TadB
MIELLLSVLVGYFFGPLVIILFGILLIAVPVALILKAFLITLSDTWQKRKERKKLKKLLEKRLSYLP